VSDGSIVVVKLKFPEMRSSCHRRHLAREVSKKHPGQQAWKPPLLISSAQDLSAVIITFAVPVSGCSSGCNAMPEDHLTSGSLRLR
jgi:hypothetical protein